MQSIGSLAQVQIEVIPYGEGHAHPRMPIHPGRLLPGLLCRVLGQRMLLVLATEARQGRQQGNSASDRLSSAVDLRADRKLPKSPRASMMSRLGCLQKDLRDVTVNRVVLMQERRM